jgi:hypothetical protein
MEPKERVAVAPGNSWLHGPLTATSYYVPIVFSGALVGKVIFSIHVCIPALKCDFWGSGQVVIEGPL